MIYIFHFWDNSFKSYYGLDKVINLNSENISVEELMSIESEQRIGLLNVSDSFIKKLEDLNYPLVIIDENGEHLISSYKLIPLEMEFFERDAKQVALELLGKIVVRKLDGNILLGKILETEAYYGDKDPASRAYKGKRTYNKGMWNPGGHIFVYMVHANWMFNITTDNTEAQAVLIRSVEPLLGLEYMYRERGRKIRELCNGPGKWTRAFGITKDMNERPLGEELIVAESPWNNFTVKRSHRIGVTQDLEEPLRFFIPSRFTSYNKIF